MLRFWVKTSLQCAAAEADFFCGGRKILQNQHFTMTDLDTDLIMADCGFTKTKHSMLRRLYFHEESHAAAIDLWNKRLKQRKYGSVGFTCYNHLIKAEKTSKRASVMGPCIQSVTLTYNHDHTTTVDAFYRTTELFKKFPADLIFIRDTLLPDFNLVDAPFKQLNFHFANVTVHPMYFVTIVPHLKNPIREMKFIADSDPYFHDWVVKWTARYLLPEYHRGIAKFAQALRVQKDAKERISDKTLSKLVPYLTKHHPGHRNEYEDDNGED